MKRAVGKNNPWQEKLNQLPANADAARSWAQMQTLLDLHLPISQPISVPQPKPAMQPILGSLKYILPIVATVAVLTYFFAQSPQEVKQKKKQEKVQVLPKLRIDTSIKDSSQLLIPSANKQELMALPKPAKTIADTNSVAPLAPIMDRLLDKTIEPQFLVPINQPQLSLSEILNNSSVTIRPEQITPGEVHTWLYKPLKTVQQRGQKSKKPKNGPLVRLKPGTKTPKTPRYRPAKEKVELITPQYALDAAVGLANFDYPNVYIGMVGSYAFNQRLLLHSGLMFNINRQLKGSYTHPGYNLNEPSTLTIIDDRKFNTLDIPMGLSYKLNPILSLKAGPLISFGLRQHNGSKLGPISNPMDTVFHGKEINSVLRATTINKIHIGFSAGFSLQFKDFMLQGAYVRQLQPYRVQSSFGGYQQTYSTFTLGVGYRLRASQQKR